jgi:N-dimethylarginine dimethylaminohydrolase
MLSYETETQELNESFNNAGENGQKTLFLMAPPYRDANLQVRDNQLALRNWDQIRRAIEKAGGTVAIGAVTSNQRIGYEEIYTRDSIVLVNGHAFFAPDSDSMRYQEDRIFNKEILNELYPMHKINIDNHALRQQASTQGGNCIEHANSGCVFFGKNQMITTDPDVLKVTLGQSDSIEFFAQKVGEISGREPVLIDMTHFHLDCVMNFLPNGKVLVKLDETSDEAVARHNLPMKEKYRILMGVLPSGLEKLSALFGRENIVTFSFDDPTADIILGTDVVNQERIKAAGLAMMTNFVTIDQTIVGNEFPQPLLEDLQKDGCSFVFPKDVGAKFFLGDHKPTCCGSVRCATLPIAMPSSSEAAKKVVMTPNIDVSRYAFNKQKDRGNLIPEAIFS